MTEGARYVRILPERESVPGRVERTPGSAEPRLLGGLDIDGRELGGEIEPRLLELRELEIDGLELRLLEIPGLDRDDEDDRGVYVLGGREIVPRLLELRELEIDGLELRLLEIPGLDRDDEDDRGVYVLGGREIVPRLLELRELEIDGLELRLLEIPGLDRNDEDDRGVYVLRGRDIEEEGRLGADRVEELRVGGRDTEGRELRAETELRPLALPPREAASWIGERRLCDDAGVEIPPYLDALDDDREDADGWAKR